MLSNFLFVSFPDPIYSPVESDFSSYDIDFVIFCQRLDSRPYTVAGLRTSYHNSFYFLFISFFQRAS